MSLAIRISRELSSRSGRNEYRNDTNWSAEAGIGISDMAMFLLVLEVVLSSGWGYSTFDELDKRFESTETLNVPDSDSKSGKDIGID